MSRPSRRVSRCRRVAVLAAALLASMSLGPGGVGARAQVVPLLDETPPPNRFVAVLYETWFNYMQARAHSVYPNYPPSGGFMYWATPQLGLYKSDDVVAVNQHLEWLADAGVDVAVVDYSNYNINSTELDTPTRTLVELVQARVRLGLPTPRLAFYLPTPDVPKLRADYYGVDMLGQPKYDPNVWFRYGAKPLVLLTTGSPGDCASASAYFTCRPMNGLTGARPALSEWSFLEVTPQGSCGWAATSAPGSACTSSFGWAEQTPVSAAQQISYMNCPTGGAGGARGRRWSVATNSGSGPEGQNFADQWTTVAGTSPTFVFVKSWNEWGAQRGDAGGACPALAGGAAFVDEFNQEFSNDIEPMTGGHGRLYLDLLKAEVAKFKQNAPNLVLRDSATGRWYFRYGRNGQQFAALNYSDVFDWAAGSSYQPFVGYFNGDGLQDIGLRDTTNGVWHFAYSNGNGTYSNTHSFQWASGSWYQPFVGDLDANGVEDIGLRDTTNGVWHFAYGNGDGTYSNTRSFQWASGSWYQPFVEDFDCDGVVDLGLRDTTTGAIHLANGDGASYHNRVNVAFEPGSNLAILGDDRSCVAQDGD